MNLQVVDCEPMAWAAHIGRQSSGIVVGEIMGLSSQCGVAKLVPPEDPAVTEIGVIVLVEVGAKQYPIFTDGETYRRLAIPDIASMHNTSMHSVRVWNIYPEDTLGFYLDAEDGEIIKEAIAEKFDTLG